MPPRLEAQLEARLVALLIHQEPGHRAHARQERTLAAHLLRRVRRSLDRRLQRAAGLRPVRRAPLGVQSAARVLPGGAYQPGGGGQRIEMGPVTQQPEMQIRRDAPDVMPQPYMGMGGFDSIMPVQVQDTPVYAPAGPSYFDDRFFNRGGMYR